MQSEQPVNVASASPLPEAASQGIVDYLRQNSQSFPDRIALRDRRANLTHGEMLAQVDRYARALVANGVRKGDRIAVLSQPSVCVMLIFLASARVGALWVGLNPRYQLPEFQYVLGDSSPKLFFAIESFENRSYSAEIETLSSIPGLERIISLGAERTSWLSLDEWLAEGEHVNESDFQDAIGLVDPSTPALLVYTSGSTGSPKGVMLRQREILVRALIENQQFPTLDFPRCPNPYPINHIAGLHFVGMFALVGGGTVIMCDRFDANQIIDMLEKKQINIFIAIPTMIQMLSDKNGFYFDLLNNLEWIVYHGAAIPKILLKKIASAHVNVGLCYGLTESCGAVTYAKGHSTTIDYDVMTNSIGSPVDLREVRIMGAEGPVVVAGGSGEIQVRADYCMQGYFRRPDATSSAFTNDQFLKTGDIARLRADGNFEFVGRKNEMFKSGGYNIYPREIELAIESNDSVELSAVLGVEDHLYGYVGRAFVKLKPDAILNVDDLQSWCRSILANYKVPKEFIILPELPLLPVGKVDKASLRKFVTKSAAA